MVHIAQHDALAAIRPAYASHALTDTAPDANPVAAAASAAFEVLVAELPGQRAALQARLDASLAAVPAHRPGTRAWPWASGRRRRSCSGGRATARTSS